MWASGFEKSSIALLHHCWIKYQNRYGKSRDISDSFFETWHLYYPQCNLAAEWHHWWQFISLHASFSGAKKGFIRLVLAYAVVLPKSCKRTLMGKVGGVTLGVVTGVTLCKNLLVLSQRLCAFFIQSMTVSDSERIFSSDFQKHWF